MSVCEKKYDKNGHKAGAIDGTRQAEVGKGKKTEKKREDLSSYGNRAISSCQWMHG